MTIENDQLVDKLKKDNEKSQRTAAYKRKKRLIVRDWFYYVIWYIRIKKGFTKISPGKNNNQSRLFKFHNQANAILSGSSDNILRYRGNQIFE